MYFCVNTINELNLCKYTEKSLEQTSLCVVEEEKNYDAY